MALQLTNNTTALKAHLKLPGSKSETNRLLILKALFENIIIENSSTSDDSRVLMEALQADKKQVNIGHAGTAMRFLTAYYAFTPGEKIVTGSQRMQNRPIKILVKALRDLGADIRYQKKKGFPPLHIYGKTPQQSTVSIAADVSSQYISALLLIAPSLPKGLQIALDGKILSRPYIDMTLDLLHNLGVQTRFKDNTIHVDPLINSPQKTFTVESDWSAASYFYSLAALADSAELELSFFKPKSLQGDATVAKFYEELGVKTTFKDQSIVLTKQAGTALPQKFEADLINYPDLAQTLAVTCVGLAIPCELRGLDNLKIKETDRLQALKNELSKFGAKVDITASTLHCMPPKDLTAQVKVSTYQDHRMAMAFAPLALKTDLSIENPGVVSKSFPEFWEALKTCGVLCQAVKKTE